ncbi:YqiA/YcfP family alpha/beta fold hydrolase [Paraglaciecola aquimarina]|uniref:YqiA/YcfP family alpha/beta fold hydrolase n=1 Tax=Paraglaciecola aquimarina TaxID=1235557 RepID=A0ABU3SUA7_9ALTE|nr:YqiA/YcfP family alpha/beta fold hydrolase [Paraglaciecola aquimarina]MDU0353573.1 YqiA/YcfP family alpha/beta fold hydrolase [Paraglaciecola aquimarina]
MQYIVIYLHGFLSSPQSHKAMQTLEFVKSHYPQLTLEIPSLGNYPKQAAATIEQIIAKYPDKKLRFIGSSLGGFLATSMCEKYAGKAVLINPAVRPFELLEGFLGEHVNPYTKETFLLEQKHIAELKALDTPLENINSQYWLLLQTADETLDYRQAEHKYQGHKMEIEQGGDHSFQNFERFLPDIFRFLLQD